MVTPTIQFDAQLATKTMAAYPKRTHIATTRALNRALTSGRAAMATLIAKDMGLKSKEAKDAVRITPATLESLQVQLAASKKRLPLSRFGAKQTARGVTYKIGQGGRGRIESAFLARLSSTHEGVFARRGKARLPIDERFGPSIGRVFDKYRSPVVTAMQETFTQRLAHELKFASTDGGA